MRIIGGKYKGKRLTAPKNLPVRPTTDFAKEGLFNVLRNEFDFEGIEVLDLFAGTGNISFEFASRGVKAITSIDQNYNCIAFIKRMSAEMQLNQLKAFKNDVFKYLQKYDTKFDLIFADPPYALEELNTIPDVIISKKLLKENGWLVVEHDKHTDFSAHPHLFKHKSYGNVHFSIFMD